MPSRIIRWYDDSGKEKFRVLPLVQKKKESAQGPPLLSKAELAKIQDRLRRYDPHGYEE